MHGALFFLGFMLLTWGAIIRLFFIQSLLRAIKTYFWTTLFIGILFLFQQAQTLATVQLFLIFPGLVFLVLGRNRFSWQTVNYARPSPPRLVASGFILLVLLASGLLLLDHLAHGRGDLLLPLAAGLIIIVLGWTGLIARRESVLILFFLSLLFQGAALTLLALARDDPSWETETELFLLILAGPLLLGAGALCRCWRTG